MLRRITTGSGGIGPRDLRPTWVNKAWSNSPEPSDLGTDEYLALCTRLHVEPSITVNVEGAGATAEERQPGLNM